MAYKAKKTDHAGAKHGRGAYWGPKQDAKKESNKLRRRAARDLAMAEERMNLEDEKDPQRGPAHSQGKHIAGTI
jgi:predicted RNA-binding protein YlxR (DUF448 family)